MAFRGWPQEAFEFYEELEANNDRDWWLAHKATYDSAVKAPMEELMAAVADEFGPMRLFRPNRDVRFSKDKSPYKTAAAAMTATEGAACYVQLSSEGLMVGGGQYHLASDQLTRFRDAIADDDAIQNGIVTALAQSETMLIHLRPNRSTSAPPKKVAITIGSSVKKPATSSAR